MLFKHQIMKQVFLLLVVGGISISSLFLNGCKKENSSLTSTTESVITTDDVADVVSDALASNNGGVIDQVNDVFEIAGGVGVGAATSLGKSASDSTSITKNFDTTTVSWTLGIYKQKSVLPLYYSVWTRYYWHQFRANGAAQKYRVTNGVVADTIKHKLLGGAGYFWTPRLVHHLKSISSDWTASNTNTDTVTINGTYSRSSVDTIKATARKGRILDQTLSLTFQNVKGPRGSRLNRSEKTSGTILGTYTATVTISGKAPFTINKSFTIILGGGTGTFTVDDTKYTADLTTGDH